MLCLVRFAKVQSLVRRNKDFCPFLDFVDVFVEFVLEFVVHVSNLYVVYHVKKVGFKIVSIIFLCSINYVYVYPWRYRLLWHKVLNAVVAEQSICQASDRRETQSYRELMRCL